MQRISHLKKEHEDMFREILVFEEMIDNGHVNYLELVYTFHKIIGLTVKHEKSLRGFLSHNNIEGLNQKAKSIFLDPRLIQGHVKVIGNAIKSRNQGIIRVALDNDGRMLISKLKENIFKREIFFDRILFLHLANIH